MAQQIDWQSYAGFANALLQWTPATFWHATPREFAAALAGWQRFIAKDTLAPAATPDDLKRLTIQFPDA
ncbi:MAG: phage tail assembly chaperone [Pseudomonadota bacterium]